MNLNLILLFLLNIWLRLEYSLAITATHDESFKPIERRSRELPVRNSLYMGPYREALENKVQLLMTQRRKPALAQQSENNDSDNVVKTSKTLGSSSSKGGIRKLSARRAKPDNEPLTTEALDTPIETEGPTSQVTQDTIDNAENYNELFLQMNVMHTPSTVKVNQDFRKVEKVKSLSAKRPTEEPSSQLGSKEYFQSDTFKKNKNRMKNPLREKRLQLLHDESFLQKHQMLGQFIYSKNIDSIGTYQITTTTSKNDIQAKHPNKKVNVKLNEFNGEKNTTFQNRLPNLRDTSSSNDVIFHAKEKIEDLDTENNETKSSIDDGVRINKFETQSSLLNDDMNINPKKRFRDPTKRVLLPESENTNTLSMHRNQNQNFHNQYQLNMQQHQNPHQGIDGIKKLSFGKNARAEYIPSSNYFEARERLRSYSNPNHEEYARPSNLYQHRYSQKVSQNPEHVNSQIQGPLPSGLHFKLLKNKKQPVARVEEAETISKKENVNQIENEHDSHLLGENRERLIQLSPSFSENSKLGDTSEIDSVTLVNAEAAPVEELNQDLVKEEEMINKEDNQGLVKDIEGAEKKTLTTNAEADSPIVLSDTAVAANEADAIAADV